MPSSGSFLRQLSGKEAWKSTSKRWGGGGGGGGGNTNNSGNGYGGGECERSCWKQVEAGLNRYNGNYNENGGSGLIMRKRVMVVVDQTSHSKHAMMWALTHVANKGDLLTLLHIIPPTSPNSQNERPSPDSSSSPYLANSLGSLCKACKPEVEVEALVIQGPKLATVISQVKKLEVSVLVLGQRKKSSPLLNCICGTSNAEGFVDQCINIAECSTIGVRKQSRGMGGYLITTRWQKDFWLLA